MIANREPSAAQDFSLRVHDSQGRVLTLLDLDDDELPLPVLDAGGQYPIPRVYEPFEPHGRHFTACIG